jgi:hypothetical protein
MSGLIQLQPKEIFPGRLFVNPEASAYDLSVLQYMVDTLYRVMKQEQAIPNQPRPHILFFEELGGRFQRVCLSQPEQLLNPGDLTVVGFCGKKRPGVERGPIDAVDDKLIEELPQHPHLLSYSTLQLESRNTVNLVLFNQPQGPEHWSASGQHVLAVSMSPHYYTVIRLHNALLPGGLMTETPLRLLRTKYYDFQADTPGGPFGNFHLKLCSSRIFGIRLALPAT